MELTLSVDILDAEIAVAGVKGEVGESAQVSVKVGGHELRQTLGKPSCPPTSAKRLGKPWWYWEICLQPDTSAGRPRVL